MLLVCKLSRRLAKLFLIHYSKLSLNCEQFDKTLQIGYFTGYLEPNELLKNSRFHERWEGVYIKAYSYLREHEGEKSHTLADTIYVRK